MLKVAQKAPQTTPTLGRTILAIDPGGSTGVAVRYPDGTFKTATLHSGEMLWEFFIERPDVVVFEIFQTGGRVDRYMIHTIELVGGIKAACLVLGLAGFAHSPQKRYPWISEATDLLKALNTPHTKHEIDALSHLLAWESSH